MTVSGENLANHINLAGETRGLLRVFKSKLKITLCLQLNVEQGHALYLQFCIYKAVEL